MFKAAAIWLKRASESLHGNCAEVDRPSMVKMTVCLHLRPLSRDEIVSGDVEEDEISMGRCLDDLAGRLPIKEMASSGSCVPSTGNGWSSSGGPSWLSGGSQLCPDLCRRYCWTLLHRFCSASSMERVDGIRTCRLNPWSMAISWSAGWSWWPMWIVHCPAPCSSRCKQMWSTPANWRTLACGRRRSVEWAECRKVVTGSMMCTAVMRHAALSGRWCWCTMTVATVPRNGICGGSGRIMTMSKGAWLSTMPSHMKRTSASHSS